MAGNISIVQNNQGPSNNKYINNIRKIKENSDGGKSPGLKPISEIPQSPFKLDTQPRGSYENQYKRARFGKNLFTSESCDESDETIGTRVGRNLFSIPEKKQVNEMEPENSDNLPSSLSTLASSRNSNDDPGVKGVSPFPSTNTATNIPFQLKSEFSKLGDSAYRRRTHSRFEEDFEKCKVLGSGCFGTVYHCLNRLDGLEYAVKTIKLKNKGEQFNSSLC